MPARRGYRELNFFIDRFGTESSWEGGGAVRDFANEEKGATSENPKMACSDAQTLHFHSEMDVSRHSKDGTP